MDQRWSYLGIWIAYYWLGELHWLRAAELCCAFFDSGVDRGSGNNLFLNLRLGLVSDSQSFSFSAGALGSHCQKPT